MSTFLATHNTAFAAGFSALLAVWVAGFGVASAQGFTPGRYGFGTPATPELIAALDVDVRADGHGLPPGRGTYEDGAVLFAQLCQDCHGENLLGGRERGGALIGGRGTLTSDTPGGRLKAIGHSPPRYLITFAGPCPTRLRVSWSRTRFTA